MFKLIRPGYSVLSDRICDNCMHSEQDAFRFDKIICHDPDNVPWPKMSVRPRKDKGEFCHNWVSRDEILNYGWVYIVN